MNTSILAGTYDTHFSRAYSKLLKVMRCIVLDLELRTMHHSHWLSKMML